MTNKYPGFKKIDTNETLGDVYKVDNGQLTPKEWDSRLSQYEGEYPRLTDD